MRDNYDFSNGIKNPFADRIKGRYTVEVHYGNETILYDLTEKDVCAEDTCLEEKADKDAPEPHQA